MNKQKIFFLAIILISLIFTVTSCTDEKSQAINEPEDEPEDEQPIAVTDLGELEQTLADFSKVLPEVLTDPELAKIVWDEAKRNEEDEPYALWSKIADKPTRKGMTLRKKVQDVLKKRSLGKSVNAEGLTSAMDEVDYLQVYVHDFENWDGKTALPSTFTLLTINDVDVNELTMYDTLGQTYTLKVDTIPPDYPIMVVGLNESTEYSYHDSSTSLSKITTELKINFTKIDLDKNASEYEPWYLGEAEIYFVQYVPDDMGKFINENDSGENNELWNFALGNRTKHKNYKCWDWKTWHYVQEKPWRAINLNTNWNSGDFINGKNYKLLVIEYDPPFYDRGANNFWCNFAGLVAFNIAFFGFQLGDESLLVAGATIFLCEMIIINDDPIGGKLGFENIVEYAIENPGTEYEWELSGAWKIKMKVE